MNQMFRSGISHKVCCTSKILLIIFQFSKISKFQITLQCSLLSCILQARNLLMDTVYRCQEKIYCFQLKWRVAQHRIESAVELLHPHYPEYSNNMFGLNVCETSMQQCLKDQKVIVNWSLRLEVIAK